MPRDAEGVDQLTTVMKDQWKEIWEAHIGHTGLQSRPETPLHLNWDYFDMTLLKGAVEYAKKRYKVSVEDRSSDGSFVPSGSGSEEGAPLGLQGGVAEHTQVKRGFA